MGPDETDGVSWNAAKANRGWLAKWRKDQPNGENDSVGGITNGMPVVVNAAITNKQTTVQIRRRHAPRIMPGAVPVVEAAVSISILDLLLAAFVVQGGFSSIGEGKDKHDKE